MKTFISKQDNFHKIEFWAATTIYVFAVFFLINMVLGQDNEPGFAGKRNEIYITYVFVSRLIRYTVLYLSYLLLNFVVVPRLVKREAIVLQIFLAVVVYLVLALAFGATDTYLKYALLRGAYAGTAAHNSVFHTSFFYASWLLLLFGFYSVIKYVGQYLLAQQEALHEKYPFIAPGSLAAFILWLMGMFFLLTGDAERGVLVIWAMVVPFAIAFYCYSFYSLLPRMLGKRKPFRGYIARTVLLLLATFMPLFMLTLPAVNDDIGVAITTFNAAFQLLITAPLTWLLFKRHLQGNEEVFVLKKELGRSNASFDFLRSQINPHFLFNALNTIYGTALQEKAERTGEGILKLGDMMRFMLQENMQEKISLGREIEYVGNYIELQKLRTDPNPGIHIQTSLEQRVGTIQIAPMLLIPFVENAFKHGISFREPSHISITLEVKGNTLYFDVYNSKHAKTDSDPEKNKSGIGLSNVRQRLQLLYPGRHELAIRETGKEFFVHLTLQLT